MTLTYSKIESLLLGLEPTIEKNGSQASYIDIFGRVMMEEKTLKSFTGIRLTLKIMEILDLELCYLWKINYLFSGTLTPNLIIHQ